MEEGQKLLDSISNENKIISNLQKLVTKGDENAEKLLKSIKEVIQIREDMLNKIKN